MPALVAKSLTVKALCWCVSSREAWRVASNVHDSISRHEEAEHTHQLRVWPHVDELSTFTFYPGGG